MFSTVYAIRVKDQNYFKVGYTDNLEQRLASLQTGNPFELTVYLKIETFFPREIEKLIHTLLEGCEMKGEWFSVEPEVIDSVFGYPTFLMTAFDVVKKGEGPFISYQIAPTSWSEDEGGPVCLSCKCITASEIEAECVRLMQSLMRILVRARDLERERMKDIGRYFNRSK